MVNRNTSSSDCRVTYASAAHGAVELFGLSFDSSEANCWARVARKVVSSSASSSANRESGSASSLMLAM